MNSLKIDYVIVGGFAAILKGNPRTTTDIDIIIQIKESEMDPLMDAFEKQDFDVIRDQVTQAFKLGYNASIFDKKSILMIDIKKAKNSDELEVLKQAKTEIICNIKIKIASIEQILYGKILYLGDTSNLTDEEMLDLTDVKDFINVFKRSEKINLVWLEKKSIDKGLESTYKRLLKLSES